MPYLRKLTLYFPHSFAKEYLAALLDSLRMTLASQVAIAGLRLKATVNGKHVRNKQQLLSDLGEDTAFSTKLGTLTLLSGTGNTWLLE